MKIFYRIRALATLVLLAALAPSAQAKPTYQQARAIYDVMGKTIDDAGIWYNKDRATRTALARDASSLVKKSEQVFGNDSSFRQCLRAVVLHQEYVSHLNALADTVQGVTSSPSPTALFSAYPNAARFGDARAWCYSEMESLNSPK
jgi:hypothetical protein